MKGDICNREDIVLLIDRFYEEVRKDDLIGRYFAHINWEKHLPTMYSFWENTLFFTGGYTGNPLKIHMDFHLKHPFSIGHFQRWEYLFLTTLDSLYCGEKTELARQRAISISTVMQVKMLLGEKNKGREQTQP